MVIPVFCFLENTRQNNRQTPAVKYFDEQPSTQVKEAETHTQQSVGE